MKERKRNTEKERESSRKYYEKLKLRRQTDPEFAAEFRRKKREQQQKRIAEIKADPVQIETYRAKRRECNNKFYNLNPEKIRINEIRRQNRKKAIENDSMSRTLINWYKRRHGLESIEAIREYQRNLHEKANELKRLFPGCNNWIERKNKEFKMQYGIEYNSIVQYMKRHGLDSIEDALEYRASRTNKGKLKKLCKSESNEIYLNRIPKTDKKQKNNNLATKFKDLEWDKCRRKIVNLELNITIDEIRIPKIEKIKNEFIQQYGAIPI